MVSKAVQRVLDKLPNAKRSGQRWLAICPAHDDHNPSLSIKEGDNGRPLLKCFAGCRFEDIVKALELQPSDLRPAASKSLRRRSPRKPNSASKPTFATSDDAKVALERRFGPVSNAWPYRNTQESIVGVVLRWDIPGGKDYRPVSLDTKTGRWFIGGMPTPRPLYCLRELEHAERVFVCEGEKSADGARSIGLTATTSPHGAKSAAQADWSPLAGKDIIILPDNNEAGEKYAQDVIQLLTELSPAPQIRIVRLPDLPEGGDIVDFLQARETDIEQAKSDIQGLVNAAAPVDRGSTPQVSSSEGALTDVRIEPFQPLPTDVLPEPVASFVHECATSIGCDESFVALPLLVGFTAAIGNSRSVQLKRGWTEPSVLWGAVIGESGTTKSPALEVALRAVRKRQNESIKEYEQALKEWEVEKEVYEAEKANWKKEAMKSKSRAADPPTEPERPVCDRCWTDDATIEALATLLKENPRGLLVIRDELSGWLHFDRYKSRGQGSEVAKWLEMFGARPLVVDRKTSGTICIPRAAVSVIGGIQPGILRRQMGQDKRDNGLLARLLLTMPPRRAKQWTDDDIDPESEKKIAEIFEHLYRLEPAKAPDGDPSPGIVTLADPAKKIWIEFYNEHAQEQADLTGDLASAWSKLEGYAARLALVHHLVRCASGLNPPAKESEIDQESMEAGIALSRWFAEETRRVYSMLAEGEEDTERRRLVELIGNKGGSVSVRDWQRRRHLSSEQAELQLDELVEVGLGRWETVAAGPKGGRMSKQFILANTVLAPTNDRSPAPPNTSADEYGEI